MHHSQYVKLFCPKSAVTQIHSIYSLVLPTDNFFDDFLFDVILRKTAGTLFISFIKTINLVSESKNNICSCQFV